MILYRPSDSRAVKSAWLILFLAITTFQASAQKYFFDSYGVKQGLSVQKVYTVLQDSKDYIWLGTASGLSRFDGKRFINYSTKNGLAPGGVKSIIEDKSGDLWLGHLNGGITRYHNNTFELAVFDSINLSGDITSIVQTSDSSLWFTSINDGAILADFPVKDIKHIRAVQYRGREGLSDQVIGSTLLKSGSYVFVADVGMRKFNPEEKKFENYRMPHMTTYFNTTCLFEDSKGNIWFGTYNGGIFKYVMSESRMEEIDLIKMGMATNWISCFEEDSRGRIWVGTWGGGIALFENGKLNICNETKGLKASKIYDIIEDIEGNIIIADETNGITLFKGDAFITMNDPAVLPDLNVNAVYRDRLGYLWFGTNAGISRYKAWSGEAPKIYNQKKSSISDEINFFREDKDGNIWIGTDKEGVIKFDLKKDRFESQPFINSKLSSDLQVKALEIDKKNRLWIGTNDGVAVGTIGEENFERYITFDSITFTSTTSLYCDPRGDLWIGINPRPGKPCVIKFNSTTEQFSGIDALTGIVPKTMVMDKEGTLYVGTEQGLICYSGDSIQAVLTRDQGLISENINLLVDGGDGSIFIGTNNGLNRYFKASGKIYSYTERNGFTGIETKENSVFRVNSDEIWFGTASGAILTRQTKLGETGLEPLTHIMGMQVNYSRRDMKPGMKLSYQERSILFDYYSICLNNPDAVRYQVKLEGADKDWQPVTDQTTAIYSGLAPGHYTFMVKASNSYGKWNEKPVEFPFVIKPPFYLTPWFISTMVLILIAAIISYIKIRERNLIKEKKILEARVEERTAEVVQKSQIIEEKNRDITASIRYAERIQRAMLPRHDMFEETFVLFMPKDIVSGDFYWMYQSGDTMFIAAVDCTGHGVPGAFMSIIGHNSLYKVVREYGITQPAEILGQLDTEVIKSIIQSQEKGINDGMDLALIAYNRKARTLEYAGAYNPLYHVRNGEVTVYKGDRFPIGMATLGQKKVFTNVSIDIEPGDMLYMCSDGYADQFGSAEVKKYKTGNIKKLLADIYMLPVNEQKIRLEKEILEWKGDLAQVDDILFMGTRVTG
ncbi:MAG: two-component regulator propeller domain-containing protein [Bacteroidales bacterium]